MKKRTLALITIAIFIVIYIGSSWYTGKVIANNIDQEITEIDQLINHSQQQLTIKTTYTDYHQGIFSTTLKLNISATDHAQLSTEKTLFDDEVTIYHGPFPWSEISKFNLMPKIASLRYTMSEKTNPILWQMANKRSFVEADLTIDYHTNLDLTIHTLPIHQINLSDGTTYDISPGWLNLKLNSDLSQFNLIVDFDHLNMKNNQFNIQMSDLLMHAQPSRSSNTNPAYQLTAAVNLLSISNRYPVTQDMQTMELNKIYYSTEIEHSQDSVLNNQNSLTVDKISFSNKLKNIVINDISLNNQNSLTHSQTISGSLYYGIGNMLFDKQDLGSGKIKITYNNLPGTLLPVLFNHSREETITPENLAKMNIHVDEARWQTQQGAIVLTLSTQFKHINTHFTALNQDNVEKLDLSFQAPLHTLAYLLAQITNADNTEITPENIQEAYQRIMLLAALIQNSSILQVDMQPNSKREAGIYSELHYDSQQNQAMMNNKLFNSKQFFSKLKLLP